MSSVDAPLYRALIGSWTLAMDAENKAPRTVEGYTETLGLFVRWLAEHGRPLDPAQLDSDTVREWLVELRDTRSASTARTRWTGLRSFFAWCAEEGEAPNALAGVRPPEVPEKLTPILGEDDVRRLLASCAGPRFVDVRDLALIHVLADTGARRSEVAGATVAGVDLRARTMEVMGKGRRPRVVPFGARTARALDRYLRARARLPMATLPALWLSGRDGRPLTGGGIYQVLRRRGRLVGLALHPHMLRHGFAHAWLVSGGSESDLMELTGWRSRQMLTRYAAITRGERAREAYRDRSPLDRL